MKYSTQIVIRLPRQKVAELFGHRDNQYQWQPGLKSITLLEGSPGEEGARSELVYDGRKGDLVMTETIIKKQFPERFHLIYRSRGVYNEVKNRFIEEEPGRTVWRNENIFRFRGMMRLMAPFMKQAFIQNTMLTMDRFKIFAEHPDKL